MDLESDTPESRRLPDTGFNAVKINGILSVPLPRRRMMILPESFTPGSALLRSVHPSQTAGVQSSPI